MSNATFDPKVDEATEIAGFTHPTLLLRRVTEILIGCLLVGSSISHIINPYEFLDAIIGYQLVGGFLSLAVAAILPYLQLVTGACLILNQMRFGANSLAALLFAIFTLVQCPAVFRGLQIECGCFGPVENKVSWLSSGWVFGLFLFASGLAMASGRELRSLRTPAAVE